jgi:hypothetical protein
LCHGTRHIDPIHKELELHVREVVIKDILGRCAPAPSKYDSRTGGDIRSPGSRPGLLCELSELGAIIIVIEWFYYDTQWSGSRICYVCRGRLAGTEVDTGGGGLVGTAGAGAFGDSPKLILMGTNRIIATTARPTSRSAPNTAMIHIQLVDFLFGSIFGLEVGAGVGTWVAFN